MSRSELDIETVEVPCRRECNSEVRQTLPMNRLKMHDWERQPNGKRRSVGFVLLVWRVPRISKGVGS